MLSDPLISSIAGSIIGFLIVSIPIAVVTRILLPWIKQLIEKFQPDCDVDDGADQAAQCVARHVGEEQARHIVHSVEQRIKDINDDIFGTEARVLKKDLPEDDIQESVIVELDILEKFAAGIRKYTWDPSSIETD